MDISPAERLRYLAEERMRIARLKWKRGDDRSHSRRVRISELRIMELEAIEECKEETPEDYCPDTPDAFFPNSDRVMAFPNFELPK